MNWTHQQGRWQGAPFTMPASNDAIPCAVERGITCGANTTTSAPRYGLHPHAEHDFYAPCLAEIHGDADEKPRTLYR